MKRKYKGSVVASAILFVTSGVMASVVGLRQYDRATSEMSWVAMSPVQAGQVITQDLIGQALVRRDELGINNPRQLLGRRAKTDIESGQAFKAKDLEIPPKSKARTLAEHIPEGRVLYTLKIGANSSVPFSQLSSGDRLDILVTGRFGVRTAATNVKLIGVMRSGSKKEAGSDKKSITSLLPQSPAKQEGAAATTLVLAVEPQHVYPLASITLKDMVSLVLHSAHDVASGNTVSVTPERTKMAVELVTGLDRSKVYVKR